MKLCLVMQVFSHVQLSGTIARQNLNITEKDITKKIYDRWCVHACMREDAGRHGSCDLFLLYLQVTFYLLSMCRSWKRTLSSSVMIVSTHNIDVSLLSFFLMCLSLSLCFLSVCQIFLAVLPLSVLQSVLPVSLSLILGDWFRRWLCQLILCSTVWDYICSCVVLWSVFPGHLCCLC